MKILISVAITFFFVVTIQAQPVQSSKKTAIVNTESGSVQGYIHNAIFTFKGIPYATAERFMPPQKTAKWTGIRSSMAYGPVAPVEATNSVDDDFEFAFQHVLGYTNENCQNLNIWTPQTNDNKKRAVMVWLHGGGFTNGSSIEQPGYDGGNLARTGDVVLVSVNHRLNVLGFLDLSAYGEKYKQSANIGMLDIIAALQWIKANISQFGGDPNNVTIFGQSGGGGKVTTLMAAPSAKGLFSKAIVESGSSRKTFGNPETSKLVGAAVLEELHLQASQVDSLAKIPYEQLLKASKIAIDKVKKNAKVEYGWGPISDGYFLPFELYSKEATAISANVPLIVGSTKNEFAPFSRETRDITLEKAREILATRYGKQSETYFNAVKKAYPNTEKPSDYTDIDFRVRPGVIAQANAHSKTTAPVYVYLFTWQSPVNDGLYKAMHCIDIPFQFNNILRCEEMTGGGKDAYELASKISSAWVNFAKTGNPNTTGLPEWPKYNSEKGSTMLFDNVCEVKGKHDAELLEIAAKQ